MIENMILIPESEYKRLKNLENEIGDLKQSIEQLKELLKEKERSLKKDSTNSGKPPSSDGLKKKTRTQSLRTQSGKNPGGQKGHKGTHLEQVENPDKVVEHKVDTCTHCHMNLSGVKATDMVKRQIFDIPAIEVHITEHQAEIKKCPSCAQNTCGVFPDNVTAHTQLGDQLKAFVVYLNIYHHIPYKRLCELVSDVFGIEISEASIFNANEKVYENLADTEKEIKEAILSSPVAHFDESGCRVGKKTAWAHVASTKDVTFYGIHAKRGAEALNKFAIYPNFKGIASHDFYSSYLNNTACEHALCHAHHLRELKALEQENEAWAKEMATFLLYVKEKMADLKTEDVLKDFGRILQSGLDYHATLPPLPKGARGRQKQRPGKNLLDRFTNHNDWVLKFFYDPRAPFTNNQAEQDIRMLKVKQKISGCFRSWEGAYIFARIRSYISTARKQGWNILDALLHSVQNNPFAIQGT